MKHRPTDPACVNYRAPRGRLSQWWHDRKRGLACLACMSRPRNLNPSVVLAALDMMLDKPHPYPRNDASILRVRIGKLRDHVAQYVDQDRG